MDNKSKIFLISGPSGAGEDSIVEGIKNKINFIQPTTTTTRDMREGESQGNPYYFISEEEFRKGIKNENFFEWAEADRGKFYGVTKKEIENTKQSGKPIIWKLDYKGVITIKKLIPEAIAILVTAPMEILEERLRNRKNDPDENFIQERLKYAKGWLENENVFDYKIENRQGKLDEAVQKVIEIINNS